MHDTWSFAVNTALLIGRSSKKMLWTLLFLTPSTCSGDGNGNSDGDGTAHGTAIESSCTSPRWSTALHETTRATASIHTPTLLPHR